MKLKCEYEIFWRKEPQLMFPKGLYPIISVHVDLFNDSTTQGLYVSVRDEHCLVVLHNDISIYVKSLYILRKYLHSSRGFEVEMEYALIKFEFKVLKDVFILF